jgi:hypothetical protein
MSMLRLDRLLEFLTSIETLMAMLWIGLALFTVALAILMYTRWGQYKPLRKCMGLSLLAHLLLAGYATTIEIVTPIIAPPEQTVRVTLGDGLDEHSPPGGAAPQMSKPTDQPWEVFPNEAVTRPEDVALERGKPDPLAEPRRLARSEETKLASSPRVDHVALKDAKLPAPKGAAALETAMRTSRDESAASIEVPLAQRRDAASPKMPGAGANDRLANGALGQPVPASTHDVPTVLLEQIVPLPRMSDTDSKVPLLTATDVLRPGKPKPAEPTAENSGDEKVASPGSQGGRLAEPSIAGVTGKLAGRTEGLPDGGLLASTTPGFGLPGTARARGNGGQQPVPDAYRLRVAPNRADVAQTHGGTAATEAAVKSALRWLANNQSADGRWDAQAHEAGQERNVLGRNRQNAGGRADTAMTGLALLSFLGSGHTHLEGPYRADVLRGLQFLLQKQASDGSLGGDAASFELMYCHAMATCALSEAYGMTHDLLLREPVRRAIDYTIAAQDSKGGGWRYRPGDPGDTSQMGWQLMALKSADLAGIPMPEPTRQGVIRYLQSVASGKDGGRASYRPGEQATHSMTAEALVCWQFLGLSRDHPACNEAGEFLMEELPADGESNLYYWYYATLGLYQLQGDHWRRWNDAIRTSLVTRQVKDGPLAGSWDTNDLWGGHGGRVYTTAMATLTLEVYYRFLPLYAGGVSEGKRPN